MADLQKETAGKGVRAAGGSKEQSECHTLSLVDRAHAELTGVVEVSSFDEETVVLETVCGELTAEGTGLRVGALDLVRGVVVIDGRVSALYYTETKEPRKKGVFAGLFRS